MLLTGTLELPYFKNPFKLVINIYSKSLFNFDIMFNNFFIHPCFALHCFLPESIVFLTEVNPIVDLSGKVIEWQTLNLCWFEMSSSLSVWNKYLAGYRILG